MNCGFDSLLGCICVKFPALSSFIQMDTHAATVFILACIIGYYVVWSVTPALHAPLMSVTNAISSVIIIGAILAAVQHVVSNSKILGFIAIVLVSINIFGGFTITSRMLAMFRKEKNRKE